MAGPKEKEERAFVVYKSDVSRMSCLVDEAALEKINTLENR
jgi:hypothetical protein